MISLHTPHVFRLALLVLLACGLALGGYSQADDDDDHEMARRALEQGQVLPLRSVLDIVERDYQGHVLEIEFEREDGRFIYEIRLLQNDGRIVKLEVDATDGSVLKARRRER